MRAASVVVSNPAGLHARLASQFCARARKYQASVVVRASGRFISARHILDLMAANIRQGETMVIHCDGEDEAAALSELLSYVGSLRE